MKFNEAWDVRGLKGWAKIVFVYLAWRQHDRPYAEVSLDRMAADLGTTKHTVCRALIELERAGVLLRRSSGGHTVTRYIVNCNAARQSTVTLRDTKDIRHMEHDDRVTVGGNRQLAAARSAIRRRQVKETFVAMCEMYEPDVKITVPMLTRELGARPSQVRTDMQYLLKHRDIPFDLIDRFGAAKPSPQAIIRHKAARKAAAEENVVPFARGSR